MKSEQKHQTAHDTISYGSGFGFLAGMSLPVGLMSLGVDFHLEELPLFVAVSIFVGSPFVGMVLLWWLFSVGVRIFGRPTMAYVNTALSLATFAALGWIAGSMATGGNLLGSICGAVGLFTPNFFLFYSKREYLYGEEASNVESAESPDISSVGDGDG